MDIYKLKFEVKLSIMILLVLIMLGEWQLFNFISGIYDSFIKEGNKLSLVEQNMIFFTLGLFLLVVFTFKSYFFYNCKIDKFYKIPVMIIFLTGFILFEWAFHTGNIALAQGTSFLIGLPSLFMSVVVFKEILIKKGEKNEKVP